MKKLAIVLSLYCGFFLSSLVKAEITVGNLIIESKYGQKLSGYVPIYATNKDELLRLKVADASDQAYQDVGFERVIKEKLTAQIQQKVPNTTAATVKVFTDTPVYENRINVVLHFDWGTEALTKAFIGKVIMSDESSEIQMNRPITENLVKVSEEQFLPSRKQAKKYATFCDHQVETNQHLLKIARLYYSPSIKATLNQYAKDIYLLNKAAFLNGKIDRIIVGSKLRIPSESDCKKTFTSISPIDTGTKLINKTCEKECSNELARLDKQLSQHVEREQKLQAKIESQEKEIKALELSLKDKPEAVTGKQQIATNDELIGLQDKNRALESEITTLKQENISLTEQLLSRVKNDESPQEIAQQVANLETALAEKNKAINLANQRNTALQEKYNQAQLNSREGWVSPEESEVKERQVQMYRSQLSAFDHNKISFTIPSFFRPIKKSLDDQVRKFPYISELEDLTDIFLLVLVLLLVLWLYHKMYIRNSRVIRKDTMLGRPLGSKISGVFKRTSNEKQKKNSEAFSQKNDDLGDDTRVNKTTETSAEVSSTHKKELIEEKPKSSSFFKLGEKAKTRKLSQEASEQKPIEKTELIKDDNNTIASDLDTIDERISAQELQIVSSGAEQTDKALSNEVSSQLYNDAQAMVSYGMIEDAAKLLREAIKRDKNCKPCLNLLREIKPDDTLVLDAVSQPDSQMMTEVIETSEKSDNHDDIGDIITPDNVDQIRMGQNTAFSPQKPQEESEQKNNEETLQTDVSVDSEVIVDDMSSDDAVDRSEKDDDINLLAQSEKNQSSEETVKTSVYDMTNSDAEVDINADDVDDIYGVDEKPFDKSEDPSVSDDIETKMYLARAFIDMGDMASAKEMLEEVVENGNKSQVEYAKKLMENYFS